MRTSSSTAKRLLKFIAGISAMAMCAAPSVFAANTEFLPTFQVETLTPASQAAFAWRNVAPNALASYFTYQPLTTADAIQVGFPASATPVAGNPHGHICGRLPADAASTADCYIITVRQLGQPMSLDFLKNVGIPGFPGPGLIQADGLTPFYDGTTLTGTLTNAWGYGSGGLGWKPYGATGPTITGNAPAAFQSVPINLFTNNTFGDPAATGIWHFPAPTIKGTSNRPVYVQWLNELPNAKPVGHDPSVDCGDNALFCYPYNRIVTHVHGAHVGPESDGLAVAWYTPKGALFGEGAFPTSLYATSTHAASPAVPIYYYPLTQEAGTIWYHDHAVGTTHLNTDMGMAGFFPITDTVEIALQTPTVGPPAVPAVLPSGNYELGFALQDRHFDVNGQMVMPAAGIYDKNDPNCVFDADNNALPGTCRRLDWMKRIGTVSATDPNPAVHLVPYVIGAPELTLGNPSYALNFPTGCQVNISKTFEGIAGVDPVTGARVTFTQCAPFPAQSATLEYFGNMPVVNGATYAVYDVDPTVYRMRLIGGTDSRTWIAQLVKQGAQPSMLTCGDGAAPAGCAVYGSTQIVPFFQVGSEQGLLTSMVKRNEIDIMGGERVDVLVDFTGLGGTTVTMKNLGDDAPYSGRFDFDGVNSVTGDMLRQPTSVLIPEIMKFRVKAPVVAASAQTPVNGAVLRGAYPTVTTTTTRTIALIEITDQYGRTMPTIDSRGYIPPGIRTTEVIPLGAQEQWDIVNTTVDAHPMHLHQVAFQAINRQAVDPIAGFMAGANHTFGAELTGNTSTAARQASVFTPSQYVVAPGSSPIPVAAYDAGLKDTIQTPPGYVVRVKALFDILGDYVWHCHILSHEEHDMMRPFRVTNTVALAAPATVTVSPVADAAGNVTVNVAAIATPPAAVQYVVQYKKTTDTFWLTDTSIVSGNRTITLPIPGAGITDTYQFRAQAIEPAIQNVHALTAPDSTWTNGNTATVSIGGLGFVTAAALPGYTVGSGLEYYTELQATGGTPGYTYAVTAGAVPPGITVFPNGIVWGSTAVAGTYNFTVTATDGLGIVTSKVFTIVVNPTVALGFSTALTLPAYTLASGTEYYTEIHAVGGTPGYSYAVTAGAVPAGTTLFSNGILWGKPTTLGTYNFTVTVTDSAAFTASAVYSLTVQ